MAISANIIYVNSLITAAKSPNPPCILLPKSNVPFRNPSRVPSCVHPLKAKKIDSNQNTKPNSLVCADCDGNGAIQCKQCEGTGVNPVDKFDGQFKAGGLCWLCRGKQEILCGSCNGAGFIGGFLSTMDE